LRSVVPVISEPLSIDAIVERFSEHDTTLVGSLRGKSLHEVKFQSGTKSVLLLSGPEEGFSRVEEERMIRFGAVPVSLGERRLRAELAPVVLTSLTANRLLEMLSGELP
jgi:RsmE family RNA methyltransferase